MTIIFLERYTSLLFTTDHHHSKCLSRIITIASKKPHTLYNVLFASIPLLTNSFVFKQNAHLKEELLRMAHNQYSLQEQLAQINASNVAAQNTSFSSNNHAELASLRRPQGNNVTSTGTSNLYEDEDIAALLQR